MIGLALKKKKRKEKEIFPTDFRTTAIDIETGKVVWGTNYMDTHWTQGMIFRRV
jgi:hypothetical protein